MKEFLELFFNFLQYCIENKIIEVWVALVLAASVVLIYFPLLKIDYVTRLIGEFKNRKESVLIKIMQDEYSSHVTKECAHQELKRINDKKLCGFDDVIRQRYCIGLADKYSELVTILFFRKFRTDIALGENQEPLIKAGKMLWFEWWVGVIYTLQFFLLAIFFISLSVFNPGELPLWKHAILYLSVVVLLWTGVIMSKQFPSREEIKLLKEIKRREEQDKH
ncbi:hypothetical protein [Raoultella terrigena]|uniref:hypothetical protein n=1 Tax=Raoultella terrigena TaxID=577 RepID=UPI001F32D49F|nr:hypothetical protein [Raoultella terrigena]